MKIQTTLFLLLFTFLICSPDVYAATKPGAKPTIWEIVEATPKKTNILDDVVDATNLNDVVEATGRKLDYDRTPVDNKVYKTRVNPRMSVTKAVMGKTAMNKLLRVSGWGYVAVESVKALLEGIDWVIDPEAQSIWRNKRDQNNSYSCEYRNSSGQIVIFSLGNDKPSRCPLVAVENWAASWGNDAKFIRWTTEINTNGSTGFEHSYKNWSGQTLTGTRLIHSRPDPDQTPSSPPEKEYLTENDLADYMLGTHKDFQDSAYKDKLPKPNTWTGVAQQFKPENRFEEENSPTVKIAQDQLDQALPESEDTIVKPTEPDPITGDKGFTLPAFCSWATPVCDFIKWFKEPPEKDDEQEEPDIDDQGIFSKTFDHVFSLSKQCPPDIPITIETEFFSGSYTFSLQWLCMIFTFLGYPLVFASHCTGIWILYEAVIRKEFKW